MKFIHMIKQVVTTFFIIIFTIITASILLLIISSKQYNTDIAESLSHKYQVCTTLPAGPYYSYILNGMECTVYDYVKVSTGVASRDQESRYREEYNLLSNWSDLTFPSIDVNARKIQQIIYKESINQKSSIEISRILDSFLYKSTKNIRWFFYLVLENSNIKVLYMLLFIFSLSLILSVVLKFFPSEDQDDYYDDYIDYEEKMYEESVESREEISNTKDKIISREVPIDSQGNTRII